MGTTDSEWGVIPLPHNKYLKYFIRIEKITINFLSPTQKEYICKKWLPFETVFGV
jgi:hypothetical protein